MRTRKYYQFTNIIQKMIILECLLVACVINHIQGVPTGNRVARNNFQEIKIHFPGEEIPILYPIETQNYDTFQGDHDGYQPDLRTLGVKDREELITPITPTFQPGKFVQEDFHPTENPRVGRLRQQEYVEEPRSGQYHKETKQNTNFDHDSSHEDLLDRGYEEDHEESSRKETEHLDHLDQKDFSDSGREKDSLYDRGAYKKGARNFEEEGKKEKFEEKEGHKKGHKTKAYNNKFHRDEIHREHKFYDDEKPHYKDLRTAKSEQVSKKKFNKDLDTYKQIFQPKYSPGRQEDEFHRAHKFYDDGKPQYKDLNVAKSEQVSKKKINKGSQPKYSPGGQTPPRDPKEKASKEFLNHNYKQYPLSVPSRNGPKFVQKKFKRTPSKASVKARDGHLQRNPSKASAETRDWRPQRTPKVAPGVRDGDHLLVSVGASIQVANNPGSTVRREGWGKQ